MGRNWLSILGPAEKVRLCNGEGAVVHSGAPPPPLAGPVAVTSAAAPLLGTVSSAAARAAPTGARETSRAAEAPAIRCRRCGRRDMVKPPRDEAKPARVPSGGRSAGKAAA